MEMISDETLSVAFDALDSFLDAAMDAFQMEAGTASEAQKYISAMADIRREQIRREEWKAFGANYLSDLSRN